MKGFKIIQESFRWLILSYERVSVLSTPLSQENLRARGDHLLVYAIATLIPVTCFLWPLPLPPLLATIHCHSAAHNGISQEGLPSSCAAGVSYHEDNLLGEGSAFFLQPAPAMPPPLPGLLYQGSASWIDFCSEATGSVALTSWMATSLRSPASSLTSARRLISTFPMPLGPCPGTGQSEVSCSDPQQCSYSNIINTIPSFSRTSEYSKATGQMCE